ncbi:Methionine ABC transporter ATP-binding protein [Candidatus Paraburkholderia calva]|nr:Methionine ABC transporter ATP-binding protein [Candidatus Paraburkholderia calva]
MSNVFTLEHVSKTFTRSGETLQALDDLSLTIRAGSFYGIVGTSGAGKSTLLRLLNLLEKPTGGTIRFHDTPLGGLQGPALRQYLSKVATVFQHFNLFHSETVAENIELPSRCAACRARCGEARLPN